MRSWRSKSQSMASYRSFSVASATPNSSASVVVCHRRVVASFEQGAINRCTIMATTRSRSRQCWAEIRRSNSSLAIIIPHRLHMAVGESFLCGEQVQWRDERLVAQEATEGFDFFFRPIGEIGQGALASFPSFAPGLAEEDRRRGVTVGDDVDVHGFHISQYIRNVKTNITNTWVHIRLEI